MPLFGKAHECKEYEYWSEKKVWIVNGMKWTLPKNKGDPHKNTSKTWTHSSQQTNTNALILRENDVLRCLWSHTKEPGSL